MSSDFGPRTPRSRARSGGTRAAGGTRAGARPGSGTRSAGTRAGSGAGRSRQREQGAPEGPIRAVAQIALGLFLSCSIGFVCFGVLLGIAYLVYSMVK